MINYITTSLMFLTKPTLESFQITVTMITLWIHNMLLFPIWSNIAYCLLNLRFSNITLRRTWPPAYPGILSQLFEHLSSLSRRRTVLCNWLLQPYTSIQGNKRLYIFKPIVNKAYAYSNMSICVVWETNV